MDKLNHRFGRRLTFKELTGKVDTGSRPSPVN
jgi:hypothetical protein